MKKNLMLTLAGIIALTGCASSPVPAADLATAARYAADLASITVKAAEPVPLIAPVFPVQPPVTFGGPDPLKCPVLLTTEAGRQVVRLEAGNINCPPQDSGRAPIWLDFSKGDHLIISYGLWSDNGSRAGAGPDVTISRKDGGPITTH